MNMILGKENWRKQCGQQDKSAALQLEEDGGGSTRESWMETSGRWAAYVPVGATTRHKVKS